MNAVDTNVLLYHIDKDEPTKRLKATALLNDLARLSTPVLLLSQVAVEVGAGLTRWMQSGKLTPDERSAYYLALSSLFPFVSPQRNLVPAAFTLTARHSLSCWDALLLAACQEAGINTLYSEDFTDGADYDGVRVVNPFA